LGTFALFCVAELPWHRLVFANERTGWKAACHLVKHRQWLTGAHAANKIGVVSLADLCWRRVRVLSHVASSQRMSLKDAVQVQSSSASAGVRNLSAFQLARQSPRLYGGFTIEVHRDGVAAFSCPVNARRESEINFFLKFFEIRR